MRQTLRSLFSSPGYVALAVITLALGIGANAAMFSVTNEFLFRPAPFVKKPGELVNVCRVQEQTKCDGWAWDDVKDIDATGVFAAVSAYREVSVLLRAGAVVQRVSALLVSGGYFPMLGVPIVQGRSFTAEESAPGSGNAAAIINPQFCRRYFGRCEGVPGQTISINSMPFTIVGITAEGFRGTEVGSETNLWIPLAQEKTARPLFPATQGRHFRSLTVIGRLKRGVPAEAATAQLRPVAKILEEASAGPKKPLQVASLPNIRLSPEFQADVARYLILLLATSGMVLAVACANVASLVLARATSRRREIATRIALGAGATHLLRQFTVESAVIGLLSAVTGTLFASWALRITPSLRPSGFDFSPDGRVFVFVFAIAVVVTAVFGIVPAAQLTSGDLSLTLKHAAAGRTPRSRGRDLLVVLQISLSLVLMVGAALFVRALQEAQGSSPGFDTRGLVEARIDLRMQGYAEAKGKLLVRELHRSLAAAPGLEGVALARTLPVGWNWSAPAMIPGHEKSASEPFVEVLTNAVTPGYFHTMGIPILAGRVFLDSDNEASAPVAVISQAMARKFWPGEHPLGKQFRLFNPWTRKPDPWITIAGVAQDVKYWDVEDSPSPMFYRPLLQDYQDEFAIVARARMPLDQVMNTLRREALAVDRDLNLFDARTMEARIADTLQDRRRNAVLIGAFGTIATLLAAIGVYALASYTMAQRTREFGLRIALGARPANIRWIVFGYCFRLAGAGLALGLGLSLVLIRFARAWLFGIKATDPAGLAAGIALLAAVMFVAALIPAERAIRTDPMRALRHD